MLSTCQIDGAMPRPAQTHLPICPTPDFSLCDEPLAHDDVPSILSQIKAAFAKPPNVASALHGQRRIRQGGRGKRTALFASRKSGGAIPVESRLELGHAIALERSYQVRDYRTQAICIALPEGRWAYPDFLVLTQSGEFEVHEVKPSIAHLSADHVRRFNVMEKLLETVGVGFKLIDANNLPTDRVLEDLLFRYTRGHCKMWTHMQIELGLAVLDEGPLSSFTDAYTILATRHLPPQLADYLYFHERWAVKPLTSTRSHGGEA